MTTFTNVTSNPEPTILSIMKNNHEHFIPDSGAMEHMMNNPIGIYNYKHLPEDQSYATIGDGDHLEIVGKGDLDIWVSNPSGKWEKVTLKDILYIPSLKYNLWSLNPQHVPYSFTLSQDKVQVHLDKDNSTDLGLFNNPESQLKSFKVKRLSNDFHEPQMTQKDCSNDPAKTMVKSTQK